MEFKPMMLLLLIWNGCNAETTPCGTNIFGSSGEIEYKLNEFVIPEEICVWTVITTSTSHFHFTKEESDFRNKDTLLSVYTFDWDGMIGAGVMGQIKGKQNLYLEGSAAIIVFSTGFENNNTGKGFRLTYSSRGSSEFTWDAPLVATNQSGVFTYEVEMNRAFISPDPGKKLSLLVVPSRRLRGRNEVGMSVQIKENIQTGSCSVGRNLAVKFYSSSAIMKEVPQNTYNYLGCTGNRLVPQYASDFVICMFSFQGNYRSGGTKTTVYWEIY